jgi:uncharacterized membrane protein
MKKKPRLRAALICAFGAAYLCANYVAAANGQASIAATLLGLLPLLAAALAAAWAARLRALALALVAAAVAVIVVYFDFLRLHTAWLYFAQHAGAMTALAIMFGATIGHDPARALCSRIALVMLRDAPEPGLMRYTRSVTLAWTIFFASSAIVSCLLFAFGPIEAWSAFANVGTPLLIGAMFVGEYVLRVRLRPHDQRIGIGEIIQAYRSHSRLDRQR